MSIATRFRRGRTAFLLVMALWLWTLPALAGDTDQTSPWPGDLSPSGLQAAITNAADPSALAPYLPEAIADAVRDYVRQTRARGLLSASTKMSLAVPPTNVRANDPFAVPDRVGETQAEVAVAVYRDTVVVGFNDSRGFTVGSSPGVGTLSGFAYSTDSGTTFTDGGTTPLALGTDMGFGDPGVDTDERGNWYYNQIYTRAAGAPNPLAEQNIAVHHGRFNGSGQLVWDLPVMCSTGNSTIGNLDKCLLACDRVTGNVYVAYTRFTATPQIEIVRSATLGSTWGAPAVLDATSSPTASKQGARPFCGPGGEVYVVWEKGANYINCPDGAGNVANTTGEIAFSRSLDLGVTYSPYAVIGTVDHSWTWSGPGDLRERGNEFPDIAVDRSGGPYNGRVYVTWHESAPWTSNLLAGAVTPEANDAGNNNPSGAEFFVPGSDVTGSISSTTDLDYWTFNAAQGQSFLFNLDPQGFACGISGTSRGMRLRLYASQNPFPFPTSFPDTLLAASSLGTFAQRIVWTAPLTGAYVVRMQRTSGTTPFTYTLRVRNLAFGAPSPARDARDAVFVESSDQGTSWSPERLLNDDPAGLENRRPFVAVDGLGHAHAFWHDSRVPGLGSYAALTNVYGTTSRDGGATWTPNYCITNEPSFFSLNTIAVPNLGDYNMAAGWGDLVVAGWSDQRLSTGDVRSGGSYLAGLGPETYTARLHFAFSLACPPETAPVAGGSTATRSFCVQNTGNLPDSYQFTVGDQTGWLVGGPVAGVIGPLDPGASACVDVSVNLPLDCLPAPNDTLLFSVNPVGDRAGAQTCMTAVSCDVPVPALVSTFGARSAPLGGVDLTWSSAAAGIVRGWNLYRSPVLEDGYVRITPEVVDMGAGGEFFFHDNPGAAGTVYYRLAGVMGDGTERVLETIAFEATPGSAAFAFDFAGPNPFHGGTSLTYTLPERTPVRIEVFSLAGKRLATLVDRTDDPGVYTVPFELSAIGGLRSGVYQVRLSAGRYSRTVQAVALH